MDNNSRKPNESLLLTWWRRARIFIASLLVAVALSACMDADNDPGPSPSASSETSASARVSPAPQSPTLSGGEQAAVRQALADYDTGDREVAKLQADPASALADAGELGRTLRSLFFSPAYSDQLRTIKELDDKGIHLEGASKIEWRVPTEVDLDSDAPQIELQQCLTLGTLKVLKGDEVIDQDESPKRQTVTMKPHFAGTTVDFWRVADLKGSGSC
ncbi:hypothetical protein ASD11_14675 [Aeromicrobium sp. Root495]|uniref:hypothetical protein n=1 Tax=Aeromicrobium sp. Root495 TaxID=1736550 RepID=UPI0006F5273F|nr:hypothetical protein [Aeromicrobium sp. Root495]KQY55754.1 hypothetical protein ASD11_14675 [Aeromicrobium sp. Root495]